MNRISTSLTALLFERRSPSQRSHVSRWRQLDNGGDSSPEQHNAAERLISAVESGSGVHLQRKELDGLIAELQGQPEALAALTRVQSTIRGHLARTASAAGSKGGWGRARSNMLKSKKAGLPDVLEWHREDKLFTDVAIKTIIAQVTCEQPFGRPRATKLSQLKIGGEPPAWHTGGASGYAVHVMPELRELKPTAKGGAEATLYDELAAQFAAHGIAVQDAPAPDTPSVLVGGRCTSNE